MVAAAEGIEFIAAFIALLAIGVRHPVLAEITVLVGLGSLGSERGQIQEQSAFIPDVHGHIYMEVTGAVIIYKDQRWGRGEIMETAMKFYIRND